MCRELLLAALYQSCKLGMGYLRHKFETCNQKSIPGETAVIFCLAEENTFVPSDSQLKAVTGNKVGSANSFEFRVVLTSYSNRLFSHSIGGTTSNVHLPRSISDQIDLHRHRSDICGVRRKMSRSLMRGDTESPVIDHLGMSAA